MTEDSLRKTDLSHMSWKEAEQVRDHRPVVLIPVGTVEQQGPHCPLGADYFVAEYFARQVAEATRSIIVPGIPYGYSEAFQGFCGTIWLKPSTLQAVVKDVCESLLSHGFDHLVIVNNHGPNEPAIEYALRQIRRDYGILIPVLWPSLLASQWVSELYAGSKAAIGHGGEPKTSMMLFVTSDDMRMDLAEKDLLREFQGLHPQSSTRALFRDLPIGLYLDIDEVSETGVKGDPRIADRDRGKMLLERLVQYGIEFVTHFRDMDTRLNRQPGSLGP
jgi:creatinine amidohydrolase